MIKIEIMDSDENILAGCHGEEEVSLLYAEEYQQGNIIKVEVSEVPGYYWLQLDDAGGRNLVYITGETRYRIPFEEARRNLSPKLFSGKRHLLWVRKARDFEYGAYRNLALNVWDQHHIQNLYPHAHANVETRGRRYLRPRTPLTG